MSGGLRHASTLSGTEKRTKKIKACPHKKGVNTGTLPPVGKARGALQSLQTIGTFEWENAVVKAMQEGQRKERNSERGFGTNVFFLLQ